MGIRQTIIQQENEEGWGAITIERLSADLRAGFEDMKELSVRNLRYMWEFAKAYPHFSIAQQPAAKLEQTTKSKRQPKVLQQDVQKTNKISERRYGAKKKY